MSKQTIYRTKMRPENRKVKSAFYYVPDPRSFVDTYDKWGEYELEVYYRWRGVIKARVMEAICMEEDKAQVKKTFTGLYGSSVEYLVNEAFAEYKNALEINKLAKKKGWKTKINEKDGKTSVSRWCFYVSLHDPINPLFVDGPEIEKLEDESKLSKESVETPYTANQYDACGYTSTSGAVSIIKRIQGEWINEM